MVAGSIAAAFPARAREDRLALEQLRLALRNLRPNFWLMPLLGAVTCVMFARWISIPVLVFWLALVTIGGSYLGVVAHIFLAGDNPAPRNWGAHAAAGYALFAISWASLAFLFWRHGDDLNQMLII